MLSRLPRGRSWLAVAAGVVILISLVPPAGSYARRYVFAESLQFTAFAVVVPALLVTGAPWRAIRLSRPRWPRRRGTAFARGVTVLGFYLGTLVAWRLPVSVDALATRPGLAVAEMATLVGTGTAMWLELVESPPLLPRLSRPLRAAFATLAMWTIWTLGYILGFSQVTWFTAYARAAGLSPVADQEIATGILWVVPAVCFVPVIYVAVLTWLKDTEDPDEGLRLMIRGQGRDGRWPRPPRGWHSA